MCMHAYKRQGKTGKQTFWPGTKFFHYELIRKSCKEGGREAERKRERESGEGAEWAAECAQIKLPL